MPQHLLRTLLLHRHCRRPVSVPVAPARKVGLLLAHVAWRPRLRGQSVMLGKNNIKASWFSRFKWLHFDKAKGRFFCKLCVSSGRANKFTEGKSADVPKADDFAKHELTADHKFAVTAACSAEAKEMSIAAGKAADWVNPRKTIESIWQKSCWLKNSDLARNTLIWLNLWLTLLKSQVCPCVVRSETNCAAVYPKIYSDQSDG